MKIPVKILKSLSKSSEFSFKIKTSKRQQAKVSVPLTVTLLNFHIKSKNNYNPELFKITIHNFFIVLERSVIIII